MVDNKSVIDRSGLAVDINALWLNFVAGLLDLAIRFKDEVKDELGLLMPQLKESFINTFWLEKEGYLADVVQNRKQIKDIRPNQLFALSLPFSCLDSFKYKSILRIIEYHLLTPVGLRSLSSTDPKYQKTYEGNQTIRDQAYHNGTVWPWLIGHYIDALVKFSDIKSVEKKTGWIFKRLEKHIKEEGGIGYISEIFDGINHIKPEDALPKHGVWQKY